MGMDATLNVRLAVRPGCDPDVRAGVLYALGLGIDDVSPRESLLVTIPVGYFRKCSAVHGWMCQHARPDEDFVEMRHIRLVDDVIYRLASMAECRKRTGNFNPFPEDEVDACLDAVRRVMASPLLRDPENDFFYYFCS